MTRLLVHIFCAHDCLLHVCIDCHSESQREGLGDDGHHDGNANDNLKQNFKDQLLIYVLVSVWVRAVSVLFTARNPIFVLAKQS